MVLTCLIRFKGYRPDMLSSLVQQLLDMSIIFSFDRRGYLRHKQYFNQNDLDKDLSGKNAIITGANAGIGYSLALSLAKRNANVYLLCRNQTRGEAALRKIIAETGNTAVSLNIIDVSDLGSVQRFLAECQLERVDIMLINAGILPHHYQLSPQGYESTLATNLLGHQLLIEELWSRLAGGRLILLSSGGMYPVPLNIEQLFTPSASRFDGVRQYALTKRAQVILAELLSKRGAEQDTIVHSMHPGWVNTGGVKTSLPAFWKRMKDNLRTPEEGADTALWLAIADQPAESSGQFWFDRKRRAKRMFYQRPTSESLKQELWNRLNAAIQDYRTA